MADDGTDRELLTQKQYARRRGWSKQYVHQLVKSGRIVLEGGLIDAVAADAALSRQRDPARDMALASPGVEAAAVQGTSVPPESPAPSLGGSFVKARTVREHYRAMREKLEYEALAGKVITREEMVDEAFRLGVHLRMAMMAGLPAVAAGFAERFGIDATAATAVLEEYVTSLLERVAAEMEAEGNRFGAQTVKQSTVISEPWRSGQLPTEATNTLEAS